MEIHRGDLEIENCHASFPHTSTAQELLSGTRKKTIQEQEGEAEKKFEMNFHSAGLRCAKTYRLADILARDY